jgi:hypothetical protein
MPVITPGERRVSPTCFAPRPVVKLVHDNVLVRFGKASRENGTTGTDEQKQQPSKQTNNASEACRKSMNTLIAENTKNDIANHRNSAGLEETLTTTLLSSERSNNRAHSNHETNGAANKMGIYWSWACRRVQTEAGLELEELPTRAPVPGDVALVRVNTMGFHKHITTAENRRLRLYPGAQFIGVFGHRYASDAFEAEVVGTDNVSLLTGAGMIGTVKSKYGNMADATQVSLIGFIREANGDRLNLKQRLFRPTTARQYPANLLYIVGTSMNSGKTTTCTRLIRGLTDMGLKVVACKLTGSVSNHDPDELAAAAAHKVTDFSDFGFASTYLTPKEELLDLFHTMLADIATANADVVLMELADGLLQRETAMLLREPTIKKAGRGVVLSASGSISALWATDHLRELGHRVVALSGRITSSPLAVREFIANDSGTPVASSLNQAEAPEGTGVELATKINAFLKNE